MRLMRITSIAGLGLILDSNAQQIAQNTDLITKLNGDETIAGSIAEAKKIVNDYTDSKVENIDLSQIALNKDAIATINGAVDVEGSTLFKLDECKSDVATLLAGRFDVADAATNSNLNKVNILNGASDVEGSVKNQLAVVIGGAPEEYDTLKELGDLIEDQEDAYAALVTVIANNKTAQETALNDHKDVFNTFIGAVDTKFSDEATVTTDAIATAVADFKTYADGAYFKLSELLGEISDDEGKKTTARTNIGALGAVEATALLGTKSTIHKLELIEVDEGKIVLDSVVQPRHIDYIYVPYAGNEYDVLPVIAGENGGEYICSKYVDNDLDGESVEVKYVQERAGQA